MNNIKGVLVLLSILAVCGLFMGAVSAASLNVTEAGTASSGVKNYTAIHGHLPGYVYISGKNVTTPSFLNIVTTYTVELSKSTKTPVTITSVSKPITPSGPATGMLKKTEYVTIANNIKNYINLHKVAPNYASSSLGHIRYESLVYMYSRIINYYQNNNMLPNYVGVNYIAGVDSKGVIISSSIDKVAPKVSSTSSLNNSVGISLTSPITIKFTENITSGTNYNNICVKNLNTTNIVPITKSISGNILTIKQTNNRLLNNIYQVYIPSGSIKDTSGNNLAATYTFKFNTGTNNGILTKTYSGHGVTFKYPSNWDLQTGSQDGSIFIMVTNFKGYTNPNDAPIFDIQISPNPADMTDQEAIDSIKNMEYPSGYTVISKSTLTINGTTAYENTLLIDDLSKFSTIMEDQQIVLVKNKNTYFMDFQATKNNYNTLKPYFDIILNSLKI